MWILKILAINLGIVFLTELSLAFLLGAKSIRKFITVLLVNIITNPLVVIVAICLTLFLTKAQYIGIFILEVIVFIAEGFMFSKFGTFNKKNPYIISLLLNVISFTAGEIIDIIL